ncbi:MAG: radical SAM protein [Verrucomicrobia bacterium]|jgi:radical SAM protein with 4Fe4S-binding SPASM domain|nr:radical SAM protein [Verrucomicrobiota bacterium]MDA1006597.1 radical SAM protein [Verrucomicrobiota bacterium]
MKYHRIIRGILEGNLRSRPYRLNISLTNLCDSRCKTCDIWKIYPEKRFALREELKTDEFRQLFRKLPSSVMWISFSGGEPHLRRDFVEIMAASFSEVRNIALVNVPNNGIRAGRCTDHWREVLAIRKRPFIHISMSIDGPREVHDDVRGVPGNYDSAMGALADIQEMIAREGNASIGIGLTISKHNYDKILPFAREVLTLGIPLKIEAADSGDLYYQGLSPDARPDLHHEGIRDTVREILALQEKMQWRRLSPFDALARNHVRGALRFLANPHRLVVPCRAATSNYALDCYGNVNPCFFYTVGLGNIRNHDYDLLALLRATQEKLGKARETIQAQQCPRCWHVCNSIDSMIDRKLRRPWTLFDV